MRLMLADLGSFKDDEPVIPLTPLEDRVLYILQRDGDHCSIYESPDGLGTRGSEQEIADELWVSKEEVTAALASMLAKGSIWKMSDPPIERRVLRWLASHPGGSIEECADDLGVGVEAVMAACVSLERKGMIRYLGEREGE